MAAIPAVNSLVDGTHLDERGQPTVWREVLIKKSEATRAFVHYIGLDEQWDEWLPLHALAPRGTRARTTQIPDVARLAAAATTPRAAVRSEAHAQFATSRTIGVASAGRTPLRKAKPSFSAAVPPSPSTTAAAAGGGGGLEYVLPPAPSTPHPVDVAAAYTYDEQGGHASAHERYDDGSGYYDGTGGYDASFGGVSAPVGGHAAWSHYAASASPGGGGAYSASGGYAGAGGGYGHGPPATPPQVAAPGALPMQQFDGFDFAPASNHSNGVSLDADAEAFRAAQRATRSHVPSFGAFRAWKLRRREARGDFRSQRDYRFTPCASCVAMLIHVGHFIAAFAFGEFQIAPIDANPFFGPSWAALRMAGGRDPRCMTTRHGGAVWGWYRVMTAMWLNAGALSLAFNTVGLVFVGCDLERGFGHIRPALLYISGGIFTTIIANLILPTTPGVGATSSLLVLCGADIVDICRYRRRHPNQPRCKRWRMKHSIGLIVVIAISLLTSFLPFVDPISNLCALVIGGALGFVFFPTRLSENLHSTGSSAMRSGLRALAAGEDPDGEVGIVGGGGRATPTSMEAGTESSGPRLSKFFRKLGRRGGTRSSPRRSAAGAGGGAGGEKKRVTFVAGVTPAPAQGGRGGGVGSGEGGHDFAVETDEWGRAVELEGGGGREAEGESEEEEEKDDGEGGGGGLRGAGETAAALAYGEEERDPATVARDEARTGVLSKLASHVRRCTRLGVSMLVLCAALVLSGACFALQGFEWCPLCTQMSCPEAAPWLCERITTCDGVES